MKSVGTLALVATITWVGIHAEAQTKVRAQTQGRVQKVAQYKAAKPQVAQYQASASQEASVPMATTVGAPVVLKPQDSMFQIAPVVGATYSTFANKVKDDSNFTGSVESVSGMQAGAQVLVGRSALQFETGLLYAERGGLIKLKGPFMGTTIESETTYKFKYLEIPLLARYATQPRSRTHFFFKGGAVIGLLQEAKAEMKGTVGGISASTDVDEKKNMQEVDGRLAVGLGMDFRLSKSMSLTLAADYQYGVTKLNKTESGSTESLYNSGLGATAGLLFDL